MSTDGDKPEPGASGSVEVQLSDPKLPAATAAPEPVEPTESAPISSGRVQAVAPEVGTDDVGGRVRAVAPEVGTDDVGGRVRAVANDPGTGPARPPRSKRITAALQGAVSGGVEKLGTGIGTLGEGVTRLGDVTKKVPLVGVSVAKLGEGLTQAGESIHGLPRVAQTRRGRLLVRSVIVGFLLVAAWITAIVAWQLQDNDTPDFRPDAEKILVAISGGSDAIGDVYEHSSPRFQEMVRKERFVDDMTDLAATVGKFREITAINETLVTTGPTGKIGRVSLTAAYEKGICKGSVSFHWDQQQWKLLGIGLELPAELEVTQAEREQRVAACKDPDDRKTCDVRDAAETILEKMRDGKAADVWDAATQVFQKQETREKFVKLTAEYRDALGAYKRLLNVTEAKTIRGTSATFDVLAEFEKSSGVRTVVAFERGSKTSPWQLRSLKIVVPMPRAEEPPDAPPPARK